MKSVAVRGLVIGEGIPKIIVPIVDNKKEDIIKSAKRILEFKADVIEWRADFFKDALNINSILNILRELRQLLDNTPLLFTFRTKREGGEKEVCYKKYTEINKAAADSGLADLIDLEMFSEKQNVFENIKNIKNAGILSIGSYHDFNKTPSKEDIIDKLCEMQNMGADILKIAVMPSNTTDVLTLMSASNEMYSNYADRPIVAISMGSKGVVSRISGEIFGSSMTFGFAGQKSAPGQIPVKDLSYTLNILHG